MGQSQSDKQKSCTCTSCHKDSAGHFAKSVKSSEGDFNGDSSKNKTLSDISPSADNHGSNISVSYIECDDIAMSDSNDYGVQFACSTTDDSTNPQARRDSDNQEPDNGTKQTEQNAKTGAISKSRKSLSTLTSNLRKVNSRAVTKQSKKNEENNCPTNLTPVKKKRPNWVMKFNCAKLKCGRNNQNAHKQERRKTKNDNCVCTCYRKTNENCLSRNAFHPDNFSSINNMNVSMCSVNSAPGNDSGELVIYDGVGTQAGNFSGNGQAIATIICEKQLTPVPKTSDNAQASICARLDQSPHEPLNGGDQTPVRNSFGHATSLIRDRNPMFGYNIDSELELCRCIKNASADANQIRTSNGAKQSKSGDSDEVAPSANRNNAVGESLYGSLTNLSGAVETNNQSLNPTSARHNENDSISFVCNHSQNAAQLFCHSGNIEIANQPIPRCIDWLCANNHPDNAANSARPVLHLPPENCVRQQPAIFYQTFSPVTRNVANTEHQHRQPAELVSRNAAAENVDSSSAEVRESGTDNNQTMTAVQFGQRRCLQLVCPTDMSVESLRALFQSHFNIDAVAKCHTQIDYVHYLVPDLLQITSCSFYWGKMDRYEAERLLDGKPEGTFLLRDSAQEEFLFSVSFRKYGRSLHARIEQWNHKFSFDSHDPGVYSSDTVCGLIEHYKDPTCCMFFEPILTLPLHRNFTFTLQHLSRATITNKLKYDTIDVLQLPNCLKAYLKEYHYRQRVRIKRFDGELQYVDFNPT